MARACALNYGFTIDRMKIDLLNGVTTFLTVAERGGFTAAAAELAISPTAVSKAIRLLERRHGVALFQRTTRRVALTEAGQALFKRLRPAAIEIHDAIEALGRYQQRPSGTLRLTAPTSTASFLFNRLLPPFHAAYPEVTLDIALDDGMVDLVAAGFDAGIRLGEAVEKDMVAVRVTPEIRWSVVGSPGYFARAGLPRKPEDLLAHESIRYRFTTSGVVHRWGFRRGRRVFTVDVTGSVIVNHRPLLAELACEDQGLAYVADVEVRALLNAGRLVPVLRSFIAADDGLFLYFPERSQSQLKLRVFIDMLRVLSSQPAFLADVLGPSAGSAALPPSTIHP
jgi:DNA-binding transcriptional LysR family regulator